MNKSNNIQAGKAKRRMRSSNTTWEKLPKRIEPILHLRQFAVKIGWLVFLGFFLIGPIVIKDTNFQGWGKIVFFVVWYSLFGYSAFRIARDLIRGLSGRNKFLDNRSQTTAQILNRRVTEHDDKYGNTTYAYYLQLEFTPTLAAVGTNSLQLEASVSKKLYEKLKASISINITYAVDDPRIFVIEGE